MVLVKILNFMTFKMRFLSLYTNKLKNWFFSLGRVYIFIPVESCNLGNAKALAIQQSKMGPIYSY